MVNISAQFHNHSRTELLGGLYLINCHKNVQLNDEFHRMCPRCALNHDETKFGQSSFTSFTFTCNPRLIRDVYRMSQTRRFLFVTESTKNRFFQRMKPTLGCASNG